MLTDIKSCNQIRHFNAYYICVKNTGGRFNLTDFN